MLYVTAAEIEALVRGVALPSLAEKAKRKLKPADPLPGQLDIVTELEAQDAARNA